EQNYTLRDEACTRSCHSGCKQYPSGRYKPVGLLHDYGESASVLFRPLTGSYDQSCSGRRLRKVVSSVSDEVNSNTGQFTNNAAIVRTFNNLRIRDYNNTRTDQAYKGGWVTTRAPNEGEFADWGNPIAEMMYEAIRYFKGTKAA